jgi:hypothetical protein
MSLQVVTHTTNKQFVNGKPIVNNQYHVNVDTNRKKLDQVNAFLIDNSKQYKYHDSLEHFLQKMSANNNSLFDLLEQEKNLSTLNNPHYKQTNYKQTNYKQTKKRKHKRKATRKAMRKAMRKYVK